MSNKVSNSNGSSQKQQDYTELDSAAEGKIVSNLTGAAPVRALNDDSTCGHISPEPTPAHEPVNGSTDVSQSRWTPDTVRPTTSEQGQPFVVETQSLPDTKSTNCAEFAQTIPADRQAEPSPFMTTGLSKPPMSHKACFEASRRSLASQIKHLKRRRATAARSQPSQSGSSPCDDENMALKPQSEG